MNLYGLLLGLYSAAGQVLLLRELISSFNGDELFIGAALFGWLLAVAAGAFLGERCLGRVRPAVLLVAGALLLPAVIAAVRLSPLIVCDIVGEVVPFTSAYVLSMLAMCPLGFVSGWLFAVITCDQALPADSIVTVYLWEGIGAFLGGVAITLCAGRLLSTLALAIAIGAAVTAAVVALSGGGRAAVAATVVLFAGVAATGLAGRLDRYLDSVKYSSYGLLASFDTHYGHEAILSRDSSHVLMTDNTIEAVHPDLETAENLLVVPLIYNPGAKKLLFLGRAEFGVAQLAAALPKLEITQVDPRAKLTPAIAHAVEGGGSVRRYDGDPISYLSKNDAAAEYDIIVVNPGEPDNYQTNRYYTTRFFTLAKKRLKHGGIVFFPTQYDTDRYLAAEKQRVVSLIYRTLCSSFANVAFWPGNMTLFVASHDRSLDLSYDAIIRRIKDVGVRTQYIHDDYLFDRLGPMKAERLLAAFGRFGGTNRLEKPVLPHYQILYRSRANPMGKRLFSLILDSPRWTLAIPLVVVLFFLATSLSNRKRNTYPLFLLFTAGLASLSLEFISFYLYQSTAGSLYSEIALLIGSFMLGLAAGTYSSHRFRNRRMEYPALLILLSATVVFLGVWKYVGPGWALYFHAVFLFVVAVATGALFVAATIRYYACRQNANRGLGYACEVAGSSVGALLTTTIFLPVIGLHWLLASLAGLVILALAGVGLTRKAS